MHRTLILFILLGLALAVLLACPFIGMESISLPVVLSKAGHETGYGIFWHIRVPRVCVGFLAGAALAVSGMAFQSLFRNPLATPYTLGVSSGAAVGAALYVWLGLSLSLLGFSGVTVFAFVGAVLAILLVYGLTRLRRGFTSATMLLAGIAVSFFFSSLIMLIQYLGEFTQAFRILRWLMGGVDVMGYEAVFNLLPLTVVGVTILFSLTHELNLLMTGEDLAVSRGVAVRRVRTLLFLATSLMVGGVVAFCGPIGFVGMMAPHICRLMVGANHRHLMPATLLFGGVFLVVCDTFARTVIAPVEIPVGVITSLLGGPFFVWLLVKSPFGSEG